MNYLPDTRQSQSPRSIPCRSRAPKSLPPPLRFICRCQYAHRPCASLQMYSFIQSPSEKSQCLVVLFFPGCPDGICVNNISLVRQKISTGQHSGGDQITPSPTSPKKGWKDKCHLHILLSPSLPRFLIFFSTSIETYQVGKVRDLYGFGYNYFVLSRTAGAIKQEIMNQRTRAAFSLQKGERPSRERSPALIYPCFVLHL